MEAMPEFVGHFLLTGPPGVGKTTFAEIAQRILFAMGLVNANLVKTNGNDLADKYVGHTKGNVAKFFEDARGGCLIIDEAYGVLNTTGSGGKFGDEAIAEIMKHLAPPEPKRPTCVVFLIGYEKPMEDFLKLNAGLSRRIQHRMKFESYSMPELRDIFLRRLHKTKNRLVADPTASKLKSPPLLSVSPSAATAAAPAIETDAKNGDSKAEGKTGVDELDTSFGALSAEAMVDDAMARVVPQAIEKENAALADRLLKAAQSIRGKRLGRHYALVKKDPMLASTFVRVDLVKAVEIINSTYQT
jgi:SpoVK/Ycf46/Vps4 family AAA+-type ATPase